MRHQETLERAADAEAAQQAAEERARVEAKARADAEAELARLRELVARMKPA